MSWQFQADQPIYTQLVARLQQQIVSGVYPPGSKLPSVRELAADAGVNPNTVQRAFAELERAGLIYTQRTAGKFVTEDAAAVAQFVHGTMLLSLLAELVLGAILYFLTYFMLRKRRNLQ